MTMHYLKIGIVVIGLAVVTYVFLPVSAKLGQPLSHPGQSIATGTQPDKSRTTQKQRSKQTKQARVTKKSGEKHETEARIEPDMTLRKEGIPRRHSGPPSKMYGGL